MDKATLIARRAVMTKTREQALANLNMLQGMIEELSFWINDIEKQEADGRDVSPEPEEDVVIEGEVEDGTVDKAAS